jgi:YggT family protein
MLVSFIHMLSLLLTLLVMVYVISTWVFPPYNEFRMAISSILDPLLAPIRKVIPPAGMLDFSAFILIILIQVLDQILTGLLH